VWDTDLKELLSAAGQFEKLAKISTADYDGNRHQDNP